MKHFLIFLMLAGFHTQAQKKLLRKASILESSGQYELSAEKYKEVLYKNAAQMEALAGLERTAQKIVDEKLTTYFIARNEGDLENAVKEFESVLQYQKELKYFNLAAKIPSYYYQDYEADKQRLKNEVTLKEAKLENEEAEKKYTEAISLFKQAKWVDAWQIFSIVDPYKESSNYLDKIRERAVRIAIVENGQNKLSKEEKLRSNLLTEIIRLENPLIRIFNRENLDQLIDEQKLGLTGLLDEQSAADLGKIMGVEMMLLTRVLNYNLSDGINSSQNKTAYKASQRRVYDAVTQTTNYVKDYLPITYQEYIVHRKLEVSFQYQLIDIATAEILTGNTIYETYETTVRYATYSGDPNTLYPSDGSVIYTKGRERANFLNLFTQKTTFPEPETMNIEMQKALSKKVAASLDDYFKK